MFGYIWNSIGSLFSSTKTENEPIPKRILKKMIIRRQRQRVRYLVQWQGSETNNTSWERAEDLNLKCPELVADFERKWTEEQTRREAEMEAVAARRNAERRRRASPESGSSAALDEGSEATPNGGSRGRAKKVKPNETSEAEPISPPAETVTSTGPPPSSSNPVRGRPRKDSYTQVQYRDKSYSLVNDGFERGFQPEEIKGMVRCEDGELLVLMKWRNRKTLNFIRAEQANRQWPDALIGFYQGRLIWHTREEFE